MGGLVVLLGQGIGYSASPAIHAAAFAACGLDWRYELRDVSGEGLAAAVDELRAPDARGANVTIPHKLAILPFLDSVDPTAERIGAVNTVSRDGTRLIGHNTDLPALAAELADLVADSGRTPAGALILGAGGGARAAGVALGDMGIASYTVGRERWTDIPDLLADADLLVNATPIGTGSDATPVPIESLRADLAVMDLVYRPDPTRLVDEARRTGASARGGAGMLLRQAAASFELWTGLPAPLDAMRLALVADLHRSMTHA
jgi:shikimate dehydrogenase